jgi:hypothetical protein
VEVTAQTDQLLERMKLVTMDSFNSAMRDLNYAAITTTSIPVAEVKQAAAGSDERDVHTETYGAFAVCAVLLVGGVAWGAFKQAAAWQLVEMLWTLLNMVLWLLGSPHVFVAIIRIIADENQFSHKFLLVATYGALLFLTGVVKFLYANCR